ncbi:MAG: DUF1722 domain-containing protein [Desulfobacterales bacterium]|nr:DUF1722 domain-containing protein [Desulfobacterales bacterium]
MRIWDIQPGYLNSRSLLGEHRELHAIVSIIVNCKKGYARHPETMRWRGHQWALMQRHRILAEEMDLRGYREKSPVCLPTGAGPWPDGYLDTPDQQFDILARKYQNTSQGRIALPRTTQQLWSSHKYSVLARDPGAYSDIGKKASRWKGRQNFADLACRLTEITRCPPSAGCIRNTLQHMWGHVSDYYDFGESPPVSEWSLVRLLQETRRLACKKSESFLISSTALSELGAWL